MQTGLEAHAGNTPSTPAPKLPWETPVITPLDIADNTAGGSIQGVSDASVFHS